MTLKCGEESLRRHEGGRGGGGGGIYLRPLEFELELRYRLIESGISGLHCPNDIGLPLFA